MKSHTKPALRAMPAAQVQISLPVQGVLRDVRHAFLGLCIDAGQKVLAAMMEADRIALCGPKGVPDTARRAVRGGTTASQVVLGGQRIAVRRPRARSMTEGELALCSFGWAAGGDPLDAATMAAIAAGVSTRRYASTQEPVPAAHQPRAASKSAVSRRFVQLSQEQLALWLARPIGELDLPVVMIDGIHFRDRVILLALGIDAQGNKHVLGLREGSTEASVEAAQAELEAFEGSAWGIKFPTVAAAWRRAWDKVIPFFAFPPEVRKVIYTTNAIESVNARLRKIIKTRGHFPSDDAATKLIWLALRNITADWGRPANTWKVAMNQFAILYEDRFTQPAYTTTTKNSSCWRDRTTRCRTSRRAGNTPGWQPTRSTRSPPSVSSTETVATARTGSTS